MNDLVENILKEIENKNYGLAIELCDKLLSHQPNSENIYELKAGCYSALKDHKKAAECYGHAVDLAVLNKIQAAEISKLHHKKGQSHLKIPEIENAAREFKSALDYNPESGKVSNDYAAALRRLDLCDEALEFANKAITLNPDSPEFYNNRGNIYYCLGMTENSILDYTKAIELNPDYPNAYFNRGSIYYESLGDKEKAKSDWLKAIELNPEYKEELSHHSEEILGLLENKDLSVSGVSEKLIPETKPEDVKTEEPAGFPEPEAPEQEDINNLADKVTIISLGEKPTEQKPKENEEKPEQISEENKTLDSVFEKTDTAKVTDLFPDTADTQDTVKEKEVLFSDYSDIFDKNPPKDEVSKKPDDFMLPEFDFKSIFRDNAIEENEPAVDVPQTESPVPIDGLKELHDEIQKPPETDEGLSGILSHIKPFEEKDEHYPEATIPEPEKKRAWYAHPVLWIILIIVIVLSGLTAGYIFLINTGNFLQQQVAQLDSTVKSVVTTSDTSAPKTENSGQKNDTLKPTEQSVEKKSEEPKPLETKFLGYLTEKQNFALFSEPDGYYVQIGSFKDKNAADEKFKLLKQNNIKGSVFETNIKDKGTLFRVRAGAFESQEKAKEVMAKFE